MNTPLRTNRSTWADARPLLASMRDVRDGAVDTPRPFAENRNYFMAAIRRRTLLPILASAAAAPAVVPIAAQAALDKRPGPPLVPLRVASYNIAAGSGGAGGDAVFDLDRTIGVLRSADADVVALQEVDRHWGERSQWRDLIGEIATALGMRSFFAPIYSLDPPEPCAPRREYGLAILSKHPIVETVNHELTRLATIADGSPEPVPMPGFPEAVIVVHGARVHVHSTHLDYRGDPAVRTAQVAETLEILGRDPVGSPGILMGDFNALPDAPELAPLWEELADAWDATSEGAGMTYPAQAPSKRIDYIALRGGITVEAIEVPEDSLVRDASDHRPVVADLLVPRGR